ncbi:uncharacterized protein PS065_008148 [Dugong dugon]
MYSESGLSHIHSDEQKNMFFLGGQNQNVKPYARKGLNQATICTPQSTRTQEECALRAVANKIFCKIDKDNTYIKKENIIRIRKQKMESYYKNNWISRNPCILLVGR